MGTVAQANKACKRNNSVGLIASNACRDSDDTNNNFNQNRIYLHKQQDSTYVIISIPSVVPRPAQEFLLRSLNICYQDQQVFYK